MQNSDILKNLDLNSESSGVDIDPRIDQISQWAYATFGAKEFEAASNEFYALGGKYFYDDSIYYARTNYFLDYFIFERPLNFEGMTKTPFAHFFCSDKFAFEYSRDEKNGFLDLRLFKHSIFCTNKVTKSEIHLRCLVTDEELSIPSDKHFDWTQGFRKGDLLQGFVYPKATALTLSSGLIIHPTDTTKLVYKYFKKQKSFDPKKVSKDLMLLARVQLEAYRHKHRPAKVVYDNRLQLA